MNRLLSASLSLPLIASILLAGCVSLEQAAPPVALLGLPTTGSKRTDLEKGRDIYITRCAKCHSVEPVKKYTTSEWERIMPVMVEKTKLTPDDNALVCAYVSAVLGR